jgi:hypothetical protein
VTTGCGGSGEGNGGCAFATDANIATHAPDSTDIIFRNVIFDS